MIPWLHINGLIILYGPELVINTAVWQSTIATHIELTLVAQPHYGRLNSLLLNCRQWLFVWHAPYCTVDYNLQLSEATSEFLIHYEYNLPDYRVTALFVSHDTRHWYKLQLEPGLLTNVHQCIVMQILCNILV